MSVLNEIDKKLLESVKTRIEKLSGLSGSADLSQKDFDFLLYYIQEKTGQALSLTTLKRIWRKEYQRLPHLSTLNMLSQLAYDQDWHTAKKRFLMQQPEVDQPALPIAQHDRKKNLSGKLVLAMLIGAVMLAGLSWYYVTRTDSSTDNIQFSAQVTTNLSIPNSVVFSYDVAGFDANNFYIQQSWDPAKMVEVSANNKKQTDIYFEPGYHYAKLLGNQQVLKEIPVHIKYNDWYVRFRYPNSELVRVSPADLHTEGYIGLKEDFLHQRFQPMDSKFQLGYMLSKDFNVDADEFLLQASVKFDSSYAPTCPMVHLLIKGNKDYAWISVGNKGCESNLGVKVGNTSINGKTNDLSALGIDAFSWQQLRVKLSNGKFTLSINNNIVQEGVYTDLLGELKEIDLFFNGIGSIADVRMGDQNGRSLITAK